ncbi:S46 family peptidase [Mesorhizobium sp. M0751]|uniref:S46 family peptidase n=1 Tax=unclassified Mesorhizobium TaxID=325217 RepID=UPI00333539CA
MRPRSASATSAAKRTIGCGRATQATSAFYRAYVAPDGSSRPYARDNVPYRPKNWLRIAAERARMDILLNFTCGAVS